MKMMFIIVADFDNRSAIVNYQLTNPVGSFNSTILLSGNKKWEHYNKNVRNLLSLLLKSQQFSILWKTYSHGHMIIVVITLATMLLRRMPMVLDWISLSLETINNGVLCGCLWTLKHNTNSTKVAINHHLHHCCHQLFHNQLVASDPTIIRFAFQ